MIISIVTALAASVLALLTFLLGNPRDSDGKLTKVGQFTVGLICCAAILNGLSVYFSHQAAEDLSADVRRNLHTIEKIEIRFWADLPMDELSLWKGRSKFSAIFQELLSKHQENGSRKTEDAEISSWTGREDAMKSTEFRFTASSSGYPAKEEDPVLFDLLNSNEIRIKLYRTHHEIDGGRIYARPFFSVFARVPSTPPVEGTVTTSVTSHVTYHLETGDFVYESATFQVPRKNWQESGSHLSLLDFESAQLIVDPFQAGSRFAAPGFDQARSGMRLKRLMISVSPGGTAYFESDSWVEHFDESGFPIYEIILPDTEDDLRRLFGLAD